MDTIFVANNEKKLSDMEAYVRVRFHDENHKSGRILVVLPFGRGETETTNMSSVDLQR